MESSRFYYTIFSKSLASEKFIPRVITLPMKELNKIWNSNNINNKFAENNLSFCSESASGYEIVKREKLGSYSNKFNRRNLLKHI
jgi:hypothetical protein